MKRVTFAYFLFAYFLHAIKHFLFAYFLYANETGVWFVRVNRVSHIVHYIYVYFQIWILMSWSSIWMKTLNFWRVMYSVTSIKNVYSVGRRGKSRSDVNVMEKISTVSDRKCRHTLSQYWHDDQRVVKGWVGGGIEWWRMWRVVWRTNTYKKWSPLVPRPFLISLCLSSFCHWL